MCEAKSEGLVFYPTTLAPVSGSVTVTTQCADNAHTTSGSSLSVRCASGGRWPGPVPQCECNEGYTIEIVGGKKICQGLVLLVACPPMTHSTQPCRVSLTALHYTCCEFLQKKLSTSTYLVHAECQLHLFVNLVLKVLPLVHVLIILPILDALPVLHVPPVLPVLTV